MATQRKAGGGRAAPSRARGGQATGKRTPTGGGPRARTKRTAQTRSAAARRRTGGGSKPRARRSAGPGGRAQRRGAQADAHDTSRCELRTGMPEVGERIRARQPMASPTAEPLQQGGHGKTQPRRSGMGRAR
ncbi:MAG: hypothetical protein LC624_08185 [Halobacteriales archaeon]|nr:hypothetical protein [Halobacteriales archaeon]